MRRLGIPAALLVVVAMLAACTPRKPPPRVTPNPPSPLIWIGLHIDRFNHEVMTRDEFDLRFDIAVALIQEAEWQAALSHLESLREARPNFWVVQLEYARASYMLFGPSDEIQEALLNSLEVHPESSAALMLLGQIAEDRSQLQESETYYRQALALREKDTAVRHGLARVLRRLERFDEAIELYSVLVAEEPRDIRLRAELATAQESAGNIDAARTNFRVIAQDHADPLVGKTLLWQFLRRHGPEEEKKTLEAELLKLQRERNQEGKKEMRPLLPSRQ